MNPKNFLQLCCLAVLLSIGSAASVKSSQGLLVIGGADSPTRYLRSAELFDPAQGWLRVSLLPKFRYQAAAAVLDNTVYVCGGVESADKPKTSSCVSYDPAADKWSIAVAPMLKERSSFGMAAVNGFLYAVAGDGESQKSVERYNPRTNSWSAVQDFPVVSNVHQVAALGDAIYVAGGTFNQTTPTKYKHLYRYDPAADSWTRLADMNVGRQSFGLAADASRGHLYAAGGWDGEDQLDSVERYDVEQERWELLSARLQTKRAGNVAAMLGGDLVVLGGVKSNADKSLHYFNTVEKLSLSETCAEFELMATMADVRDYPSVVTIKMA